MATATGTSNTTNTTNGWFWTYAYAGGYTKIRDEVGDALATLGLTREADPAKVRREFRRLAKLHHPDVGGDAPRFREIMAAYARLKKEGWA